MKGGVIIKGITKILVVFLAVVILGTSLMSASAIQMASSESSMIKSAVTTSSLNSTYNNASNKVSSAVKSAETKFSQLYDLDKELIDSYISQAKSEIKRMETLKSNISNLLNTSPNSSQIDTLVGQFNEAEARVDELCTLINVSLIESKVVSARSIWYRPCESTYAEIKANVEMFKSIGINLIFVETFYHGMSAFRSEISDIPYHTSLASSYIDQENKIMYEDYLSAFVACCVENGIEVHAWVENFYVGINAGTKIVAEHPDWVMYNDDGTVTQRKEGGAYIFIDPANKEVQDLLINFYNELFEKHPDVKGLNLDYIRYPVSNQSQDTGFTVSAMKGFYDLLGKEFTDAQLSDRKTMYNKFKQLFDKNYLLGGQTEADANYKRWVEYRTQVITDFVYRIKTEVKEPNKIVLSTAVFASLSESLNAKKADWQTWFREGWIEIATPMAYYSTASAVLSNVKSMISIGGNKCLYYTGIASSYSGLPAYQNKEFIEAAYSAGTCGYVIFSGAQIVGHKDVQNVLASGVNNKWAVLPHASIDVILKASFDDLIDKADRLYVPSGEMNSANREALKEKLDGILQMPYSTQEEIEAIYLELQELLNGELKSLATGYSLQRLTENVDYLSDIIKTRSLMPIVEEEIVPPDEEPDKEPDDNGTTDNDGGEADNEEDKTDDTTNNDGVDDDNGANDESDKQPSVEAPAKKSFFVRFIEAIMLFFKKLFGLA
ncbi:MAG: family 10 glycosylhydrolase [Clostridia bacterium]|nr:family 10 glycosylhydrolase [Clostridia bacterium]